MERNPVSVDAMSIVGLAWIALGSNLSLRGGNSTTNLRSLDTVFKAKDKRELYVKIKLVPHMKHFLYKDRNFRYFSNTVQNKWMSIMWNFLNFKHNST
jgi:hypothetical protein